MGAPAPVSSQGEQVTESYWNECDLSHRRYMQSPGV